MSDLKQTLLLILHLRNISYQSRSQIEETEYLNLLQKVDSNIGVLIDSAKDTERLDWLDVPGLNIHKLARVRSELMANADMTLRDAIDRAKSSAEFMRSITPPEPE